MSLKVEIEKIFTQSTNYSEAIQAVNQASSLNSLSADLYTDSKRFIYELLQNADDSSQNNESVKVWITISNEYLIFAHSGKSFSIRDLHGICNIDNGTKKSDTTKTGYKGIGFKSVFGQSEHVTIYTNEDFFRFDSSYPHEWKWENTQAVWEKQNDKKFQYPWQIIPIYTNQTEIPEQIKQFLNDKDVNVATIIKLKNVKETTHAIQSLSERLNMFLFLKNISEINIDVINETSIEIIRKENERISLIKNKTLESDWLSKKIKLKVSDEVKAKLIDEHNLPDKLKNAENVELSLAAKIGKEGIMKLSSHDKLLYSYLPTDESKYALPVLINTSFLTNANRENLHVNSKWNQWLFKNIAIEIFKWIAELVISEFQFQAYRLIPENTFKDILGEEFNKGIDEAINTIPFITTTKQPLSKVKETIVDFTFLSEKEFVGESIIKDFVESKNSASYKSFAKYTGFGTLFKRLGASSFEWKDVQSFLLSQNFINSHTIDKNIKLIKHFKFLSESEKVPDISLETLRAFPFIWDHKNYIKYPSQVCFPAPDDQNWNNPNSDLSFLHQELQNWLHSEPATREWLEELGMAEKTDITYINQTILPNIDSYITLENATITIQDLFLLYQKGDLKKDLIGQLSRLKLLTQKGTLLPATECYLSDFYRPRLEIEEALNEDIFVSSSYYINNQEKDEWKRFFKLMGVKEGICPISYDKKNKSTLISEYQFKNGYFEEENKFFQPWQTKFKADVYSNLTTLLFLSYTEDFGFAKLFWTDCICNIEFETINSSAIAFWGRDGYAGRNTGDKVDNYLNWFIRQNDCIPTLMNTCQKADDVFLNSEEIIKISGNYLPVFSGVELSQNWKSFFKFKTKLELPDYLELLSKISNDLSDRENIKKGNYERIQSIYSILLDQCTNWNVDEISVIEEWAENWSLLNTKNLFTKCTSLKYFIDGNESIFQEQFKFLSLNAENKNHSSLNDFLTYFKIKILKQGDFKLEHSKTEECSSLMQHLKSIIPYFKIWVKDEINDDKTIESLKKLDSKIAKLKIYQAEELLIKYEDIAFLKKVSVHFDKSNLYVTNPWNTNSVFLKLPEILCRYFYLLGHDKKLDFLLRSSLKEILDHFAQEKINIPEDISEIIEDTTTSHLQEGKNSSLEGFDNAVEEGVVQLEEFFHTSKADYYSLKYAERIIVRAVFNVLNHLKEIPEYDCTYASQIAKSIIGGITKNGNEITIVTRPSDGGEVLPYYSSELDVLEYVDAEFWCEDGINTPKQITLGQLLKKTGINRIPVDNINLSDIEVKGLLNTPKNDKFDFNPVPFVPQKIARILSSFANTKGGILAFGLKEINKNANAIVGLSSDFRNIEIVNKAISLLSPIPTITYDLIVHDKKSIFVIKTEKSDSEVFLDDKKYIREDANTKLENETFKETTILNSPKYAKTIAIIIGIEEYHPANSISPVKYANNDVLKFKQMLIDIMHVDEKDIIIFQNENALKSSIEYNLKSLFHALTEDDRLIFYYVGHGFHNGVTNYLTTYDTHKHHIAETGISLRKILLDPLRKSKCKTAFIFIDACAQTFHDPNERSQITNIDDEEFIALTHDFPYYGTFLSCYPEQKSYSSDILSNGIWTYHLVNALSGNVVEIVKGKYITDVSVKEYLSVKVAEYTKAELQKEQNPKAILDSGSENVIIELE